MGAKYDLNENIHLLGYAANPRAARVVVVNWNLRALAVFFVKIVCGNAATADCE